MMRISPHLQRSVVKLHLQQPDMSSRKLTAAVGAASANTVSKLRLFADSSGISLDQLETLNDSQLSNLLFNTSANSTESDLPESIWQEVNSLMSQEDGTLSVIWADYKNLNPKGWCYAHFAKMYRRWLKKQKLSLRKKHRAGENTFIDFAGGTLPIHLPDGSVRVAQLYLAVMGCSNYTFGYLVWSQTSADWIDCNNRMVQFFGGVTKQQIPDNLKAAVIRAGISKLIINDVYRAWASHHDTIVLPAGPLKPKHKAKVEVGVQIAQRLCLFRMRQHRWHSLEEANAGLARLLKAFNERPFQKLPGCRKSQFEKLDLPLLKRLRARLRSSRAFVLGIEP